MTLRIPPALVFLIFAAAMYVLAIYLPVGYFDFFGRYLLIKILIAIAIIAGSLAIFQFFRSKTSIDPSKLSKTTALVTKGVYRFSRNPMYLSLLLLLLAWGLWLGNAFNSIIAAAFVSYMNKYQIIPEEGMLSELFGKEYEQYKIRVRRWF